MRGGYVIIGKGGADFKGSALLILASGLSSSSSSPKLSPPFGFLVESGFEDKEGNAGLVEGEDCGNYVTGGGT